MLAKRFIPKEKPLTARQLEFARQFIIDNNATQAAIRSGYSKKTARAIAAENLTKANVIKFIEVLKEDLRKQLNLDAAYIAQELRDIAEYNIQDFLLPGNRVRDITTLSRRLTKAITAIKSKETFLPGGITEVVTELKFSDRKGAWEQLGKHLGFYEKDNMQKATPNTELTDDQFQRLLTEARASVKK
ncbi:MAG: terminase small subunit [Ferruginibacter sp.]